MGGHARVEWPSVVCVTKDKLRERGGDGRGGGNRHECRGESGRVGPARDGHQEPPGGGGEEAVASQRGGNAVVDGTEDEGGGRGHGGGGGGGQD